MKNFAELSKTLDETAKTSEKISLLTDYFKSSNPEDSIWAVSLLIGRKPKQIIPVGRLKEWVLELANIPDWLFKESYNSVGDITETITLLLPKATSTTNKSLQYWIEEKLLPFQNKNEKEQKEEIISAWNEMNNNERFVWNKLITGSFRAGISVKTVIKALSIFSGMAVSVVSYRMIGNWEPTRELFNKIISNDQKDEELCKTYPFCIPYRLDNDIENLGNVNEWYVEWMWDGMRCQIIKREGKILIWYRGEEMMNEKFPELEDLGFLIPDGTVIDGEVIPWQGGKPMPFSELQKRIKRKNVSKKVLSDIPVVVIAYDLVEYNSKDIREVPLVTRKKLLLSLVDEISDKRLLISSQIESNSWDEIKEKWKESRSRCVNGLILKRNSSVYCVGISKGNWWKWEIDPFTIDAVLIYAQRVQGVKANLFTEFTFGVWDGNELVPFAKVNSGLNDEEILKIDSFIRNNTIEKFGPVCTVKPKLVFELAFDGIQKSLRHKSGIVVRSPRINRWGKDKKIQDADNLEEIKSLIN